MTDVNLKSTKRDYAISVTRGILGAVPFAGGALQELITNVVPNQRIDRVARFAKTLEERLGQFEDDYLRRKAFEENFAELLEDSVIQAARTGSDARHAYIANLIGNSLSDESLMAQDRRHLLQILGQLNDREILILRFHLIEMKGFPPKQSDEDMDFLRKHGALVNINIYFSHNASMEDRENVAIHKSYLHHLTSLGLLSAHVSIDNMGKEIPEGRIEEYGHEISNLGKILLRFIGFHHEKLDDVS